MFSRFWQCVMIATSVWTTQAAAQQSAELGWSGDAELGLVTTSGNSDTRSARIRFETTYNSDNWRQQLRAAFLNASDSGQTTAERYELGAQSDYKLSAVSYVFGSLRYEKDDFSSFEEQSTVAAGYGRQLLDDPVHKLKVEGGLGYRTASPQDGGSSESDAIARGLLDWSWQLTATTTLTERLLTEAGADNVFLQNDLGVDVAINARLALKLGFQVRHNTDSQPGLENTDMLTSASIRYRF